MCRILSKISLNSIGQNLIYKSWIWYQLWIILSEMCWIWSKMCRIWSKMYGIWSKKYQIWYKM